MSSNLIVKSLHSKYEVKFIDSFKKEIIKNNKENNFYIIDLKIYKLNEIFFKNKISKNKTLLIKSNESSKLFSKMDFFAKKLVGLKINSKSTLNLIGGGVIQDIGAFLSSILFRGISYNFFPTTLLAQCDSCIGSKTSINLDKFKNLIGNFWHPKTVYIDFNFLNSLDETSFKSGIGEMCHYFIYNNINYFYHFMKKYDDILIDKSKIHTFINKSLRIKKRVIEIDEFDKSERRKFNYGHTFGHALEAITNYKINHGQAVTLGMDLANFISLKKSKITNKKYVLINSYLKKNFPNYNLANLNIKKYLNILSKDKKNINNKLGCILLDNNNDLNLNYLKFDQNLENILIEYFK